MRSTISPILFYGNTRNQIPETYLNTLGLWIDEYCLCNRCFAIETFVGVNNPCALHQMLPELGYEI